MAKHAISWFEIPVTDLERAATFYETVLGTAFERMDLGGPTAVFPADEDGVGGALIFDGGEPSLTGPLVYLDTNGELDEALARVANAGGEVLLAKTSAGGYGFYAYIKDTEGNRVALFESP
jgi:predicted enzyme related to lactoylglutathione lyase